MRSPRFRCDRTIEGAGITLDTCPYVKTNRTLWSWLMDVFAPAPVPVVAQVAPRRNLVRLDTPQAFSVQELRWA